MVRATLLKAWSFANPFSIEELEPNKFLFSFTQKHQLDGVVNQAPWNVRGSLLSLKPWKPLPTIEETDLNLCPFRVQIHGLPLQNMTTKNAVSIGKGLGNVLEVENLVILASSVGDFFGSEWN